MVLPTTSEVALAEPTYQEKATLPVVPAATTVSVGVQVLPRSARDGVPVISPVLGLMVRPPDRPLAE